MSLPLITPSRADTLTTPFFKTYLLQSNNEKVGLFILPEESPRLNSNLYRTVLSKTELSSLSTIQNPTQQFLRLMQLSFRRLVLSHWLQALPDQIHFSIGSYGKPALKPPYDPYFFSISHTGRYWALALSTLGHIGLDIEDICFPRTIHSLSKRVFHPNEYQHYISLPPHQQKLFFLRCWTQKEAYGKAHAKGLQLGFSDHDTTSHPCQTGQTGDVIWSAYTLRSTH